MMQTFHHPFILLCVAALTATTAFAVPTPNAGNDLAVIKERLCNRYLKNTNSSKEPVSQLLATLQLDGSWKDYNYDERPRLGLAAIGHLYRLVAMCIAYRSPDSTLYKNKTLQEKIHLALNHWYNKDPETNHHWFNEIGAPREMAKILVLMEDELSAEERAKGVRILRKANVGGVLKYGATKATGQNMIWIARIQTEAGCLQGDTAYVKFSVGEIGKEIVVTTAEGIQPDWSFHQHGPQLYSGGYGLSFTRDCAEFATVVANTEFALGEARIDALSHYILDVQQWMTRGDFMDYGTMGREIARMDKNAVPIAAACDDMASLNTARREEFVRFSARIKGLLPAGEGPDGNRHFYRSDFTVHQRPQFYTSVKMVSNRIYGSETGNGEANFNYHTPDGLTYLVKIGDEYRNIFPVWDWRKLPGVTCRQNNLTLPLMTFGQNSSGKTSFVGGVSDGRYGAAAFNYDKDSVKARKAWFYFDTEIVCLGAGITSNSGDTVTTAVNQCFSKSRAIASNRKTANVVSFNGRGWVHHDGTAYVFPEGGNVQGKIERRTADWRVINTFAPTTRTETGNVFTLWIDHGRNPSAASYSYIVVPEIKKEAAAIEAASKNVSILSNTPALQAVKSKSLGLVQVAFYKPGRLTIDEGTSLEVDAPCLLLYQRTKASVGLTVSNPENKAASVTVKVVTGKAAAAGKNFETVFDLPGGDGAGQSITKYFSH